MWDGRTINNRWVVDLWVFPRWGFRVRFVLLVLGYFIEKRGWSLFGDLWSFFEWYLSALLVVLLVEIRLIVVLGFYIMGGLSWD